MRATYAATIALTAIVIAGQHAGAQESPGNDPRRSFASRGTLEAQAAEAERVAADASRPPAVREYRRGEAWVIRYRLEHGDFSPGDRIAVSVAGEQALGDTVTIQAGGTISLGVIPPISLRGVLRSELHTHLERELSRFIRDPHVTAVPLLRFAVFGEVVSPGYYHVPADILLSDLLMKAGGPSSTADVQRSHMKRGPDDLYQAESVRTALTGGLTLDGLHLRSGDEFVVGQRRQLNWRTAVQGVTLVTGLISIFIRMRN